MIARDSYYAISAAIIANFIWGSTFMASKVILSEAPPITAALCRFGVAVGTLFIILILKRNNFQFHILKARSPELVTLGIFGYSALYILQMVGLQHIASSQSAAIMLLAPIFTLIAESIIRRKMSITDALITACGFFGAVTILMDQYTITFSDIPFVGLLLTVAASFFLGTSVIQTKRLLASTEQTEGFSVYNLTLYSLLIGMLGIIPFAIFEQSTVGIRLPNSFEFWGWSLYLGVICSVGAFLLWNGAIKYISPIAVSVSIYLKTPVALLFGALFLGEHLSGHVPGLVEI